MKKKADFGFIYEKKSKKYFFPLLLGLIIAILIIALIILIFRVYKQANELINTDSNPFPDVVENAMPIHDTVAFQSEDHTITLEGWFFAKTSDESRGSVVFIHDNHANRVQYGLDTADLFSSLMDSGFNVLAFDLRHSGRSNGSISTYGYSEYKDVISAISYVKKLTADNRILLYGVGTGVTSGLLAWNYLKPLAKAEEDQDYSPDVPVREDIIGFIFDTPTLSADDYIRADLPNTTLYDHLIAQKYVPAAVRATAGFDEKTNNLSIISQIPDPVLITRNLPDTRIDAAAIDTIIAERLKLHPETTTVFEISEKGHLNGFNLNQERYLNYLHEFLDIWYEDNSLQGES